MKRLFFAVFVLVFALGCQKKNSELLDQLAKLDQRVQVLEKRLSAAPQNQPRVEEQAEAFNIPVGGSYVLGNPTAPITLSVFTDIQCPFCEKAHEGLVEKIKEDPELKDKVKVVMKHFPLSFHKNAMDAAKATLAAGEQGPDCFWKYTRLLYKNQRDLSPENYVKWADGLSCVINGKEARLNVEQFKKDLATKDQKFKAEIEANMKLAGEVGVRGTPTLFVDGWKLPQRTVDGVKQIMKEKNLGNK